MQVHEAVLGWVFNLQSWQAEQGMAGGGDTAESQLWRRQFDGKDVLIAGGVSVAQQALANGLVDELDLDLTPVLVGSGLRLLDSSKTDSGC